MLITVAEVLVGDYLYIPERDTYERVVEVKVNNTCVLVACKDRAAYRQYVPGAKVDVIRRYQ